MISLSLIGFKGFTIKSHLYAVGYALLSALLTYSFLESPTFERVFTAFVCGFIAIYIYVFFDKLTYDGQRSPILTMLGIVLAIIFLVLAT